MRIGRVHAHQNALLPVGFAVAICVSDEPQVWRLHHEHAVFVELKAGRAIQVVQKVCDLVGLAVAVGVFEHQQAVAALAGGRALGITRPGGDPQAPPGIEGHLNRVDELGELFLAREQIRFAPLGQGHVSDGFLAAEEGVDVDFVRLERLDRREVRVINFEIAAPRHRPDALVAVGAPYVALRHFLLHHLEVGNQRAFLSGRREGQFGTSPINVVTIHSPVAGVPFAVFVQHREAQFIEIGGRRRFAKEGHEDFGRERLVARLGEEEGIKGEGMALPGRLLVEALRRVEKVHKQRVVGFSHLRHRDGIELKVGVVRARIGQVRVGQLFVGDRGEEHEARRAFAAVVRLPGVLEKFLEVLLERSDSLRPLERLVEAVEGENHVGTGLGQPIVA